MLMNAGVEINFSNHLPVEQVISHVYLLKEISTCLAQLGTVYLVG